MSKLSLFMSYAVIAIFAENLVLTGGIGASRLIRAVRRPKELLGYSLLVTFFTVAAQLLTFPLNLLIKNNAAAVYIRPVLFAVCIAVLYAGTMFFTKRFIPSVYTKHEHLFTHCAFNGIVIGVPLIITLGNYSFFEALGFSVGASAGFMLAALLVSEGLRRLDNAQLPRAFRGIPASLLYIGILSLAFAGFSGV